MSCSGVLAAGASPKPLKALGFRIYERVRGSGFREFRA